MYWASIGQKLGAVLYVHDKNEQEIWNSDSGATGTAWEDFNWDYEKYPYMSYSNDASTRYNTWGNLAELRTVQFVIAGDQKDAVDNLYLKIDMPYGMRFRALYRDSSVDYDSGDTLSFQGLLGGSGNPLHITIYAIDDNGIRTYIIWTVWISFRHQWRDDLDPGHYCHLTTALADQTKNFAWGFDSDLSLSDSKNCQLNKPGYRGFDGNGQQTCQNVEYLQFIGPLVDMTDGEFINIHLDDWVDVDIPLTNNYARHTMNPSDSCDYICKFLVGEDPFDGPQWNAALAGCDLKSSEVVAKEGLGQVRVSGFGRINGFSLQDGSAEYGGRKHWDHDQPGCDVKGGLQNALWGCEFAVMAGLLHLAQGDMVTTPDGSPPVDVFEVAVAFGAAIGDAAVLVNPGYAAMGNGGVPADNAAKLYDVKTPGSFVDAADGPNLFGTGSQILSCYLQHADDTVKISASDSHFLGNTVLHGNTGSVVLLGNFGSGLFSNKVTEAVLTGLYVHYVWMTGEKDQQGPNTHTGILGMQTCLSAQADIYFDTVTVESVWVASLGADKTKVNRAISMGALDPGYTANPSPFCASTDDLLIKNVYLKNLFLKQWDVYEEPEYWSLLFSNSNDLNTYQRGYLVVENLQFYDLNCKENFDCILTSAVKMHHEDNPGQGGYFVCAMEQLTRNCMDAQGAYWQSGQFCETGGDATCQNFESFQVDSATSGPNGNLWFPTYAGL